MAFHQRRTIQQGLTSNSPIPTRIISNEEFTPIPQTRLQHHVDHETETRSTQLATQLGMDRRTFLKTTGGMAVALLAMNHVFGKFFDVQAVEAAEPEAFLARRGGDIFVFDVQTHYVSSTFTNPGWRESLLSLRQRAKEMGLSPALAHDWKSMGE